MRHTGTEVQRACIDLGSATLYNSRELLRWFGANGFEPRWVSETQMMGLYLIAKL
jgi:hypothetical protein